MLAVQLGKKKGTRPDSAQGLIWAKHERECLGGEADEHEKLDGFPDTACRLG